MDWTLHAHDVVLPAGRVLGLVITLSDNGYTIPSSTGATVDVDLGRSRLWLPVSLVPGTATLPATTLAPEVATTLAPEVAEGISAERWSSFR